MTPSRPQADLEQKKAEGDALITAASSSSTRVGRLVRHPDSTRAMILEAAIQEFAAKGFAGARVDAIALRSKTNKRMLYHFFGDKAGLYIAVLEAIFTHVTSSMRGLGLANRDPADGIRTLVLHTWHYLLGHPEFVSLMATENLLKGEYSKRSKMISSLHDPVFAEIEKLLQRGAEQGVFREGINPMTVYMTYAGLGFFYISNRHTLETNLNPDVWTCNSIEAWGEHIVAVTLAFLGMGAKSPSVRQDP